MREGYKKTEVGIIPEDWEVKSLIDVVDKNDRYSFTGGPFGSDLKSCHYTEDGVRVIQLQNIGDGYFNDDYKIYTSIEKANELKGCNIYPGDIIIAKMADPVARACMIPEVEERYLMCSDGIRLNVDCSEYDKNYILYSINSSYFRKNAEANSTGSTRLRIGLSQLKELKIIKAPLKEQEKIAEILSTVDSQIDDTEKLIEKFNELKKGLMQKLLTKGIDHSEFKKTEIGEIPVSWEVKKVGDIIETQTGYPFKSELFSTDSGVPLIRIRDIKNSSISTFYTGEYSKDYIVNFDDILVGMDGEFNISKWKNEKGLLNQRICRIYNKQKNDINYIFYSLIDILKIIERETPSTTVKHLVIKDLLNRKIAVPNYKEQMTIGNIILTMDNQIQEYENKKQKLEELKKGLVQQLLTGKIRVTI